MHATLQAERTLTELDFARLTKLAGPQPAPMLDDILTNAEVTTARSIGADVVTMHSRVELADVATGSRQVLTLCYPHEADPTAGRISVLSPVGQGLLGLRVGDIARWRTPGGDAGAAGIVALPYQPEAAGDYTA